MRHGLYEVVGTLDYRGHSPGTRFVARLDRAAEVRAFNRGNIILIEEIEPILPDEHGLPAGWLTAGLTTNGVPSGAPVVERGN
jgi:hypothetical protein